ncbi:hypothetical protein PG994_005424 [Apiospora phragmitis]|uniref:Uncharacterized protein n=1 Tax=Apiospora phragmitis TaxID=2905665 RepID=A0ABR1VFY2_9PEZI
MNQKRAEELFDQVWKRGSAEQFHCAQREYALTCLFNPNELLEGAFDPRATMQPDWDGGHYDEIQGTPLVGGEGGLAYDKALANLGQGILWHSCSVPFDSYSPDQASSEAQLWQSSNCQRLCCCDLCCSVDLCDDGSDEVPNFKYLPNL